MFSFFKCKEKFDKYTECYHSGCGVVLEKKECNSVEVYDYTFAQNFIMYYCPTHSKKYDILRMLIPVSGKEVKCLKKYYKKEVECNEDGTIK